MNADVPPDEVERLLALQRFAVLDTLPEEPFDRLTRLVGRFFHAPIALLSFVDEDRQWFKACIGLDLRETDRSLSFCAHALLERGVLVVPDATQDARFADNGLVTGHPYIRFYAGAPLITVEGFKLGTLCILDDQPRPDLTEDERGVLVDFAATVMDELEWRAARARLETEDAARAHMLADLRRSTQEAQTLVAVTHLADLDLSVPELMKATGELLAQVTSVDWVGLHTPSEAHRLDATMWQGTSASPEFLRLMEELNGQPNVGRSGVAFRVLEANASLFLNEVEGQPDIHPAFVAAGVRSAAWLPLSTANGVRHVVAFVRFGGMDRWRTSDRVLLEAAVRTINLSLSRREHLQRAAALAFVDALTTLPNRRALEEDLNIRCAAGTPFVVVLVDLDGLKHINDTGGHARGDALLRLFAEGLRVGSGEGEGTGHRAYRLGGDEFALLVWGDAAQGDPLLVEDWALEHVDVAVSVTRNAGFGEASASAGVARWPDEAEEKAALLVLADERMYARKRERKARGARGRAEALPQGPASEEDRAADP